MTIRLFIILLMTFSWISTHGRAEVVNDEKGIEVIGPDVVDFGKYSARDRKVANFKIRNAGTETIRIIKIYKTCICATAACDKTELKPEEEASVEIVVLPNSISGSYSNLIYIESSCIKSKFLPVTVTGIAVPLIEIKPQDFVYAGRIETNKQWEQSFDITTTEAGLKLNTLEAKCNYPVETALKPVDGKDSGHYRLDFKLLPATTSGNFQCSMRIPVILPVNHPPLTFGVAGKIGAELIAYPGTFRMPVSSNEIVRTFNLRILGDKLQVLDPAQLKLTEEKGVLFKAKQAKDGRTIDVTARFPPEFSKEVFVQGRVELFFAIPGIASAKVLCLAE